MDTKKIVSLYVDDKYTLRMIAIKFNTNHHMIKRILIKNGIKITQKDRIRKVFSEQHKKNISIACKGRASWCKGKKMPNISLYKNMIAHSRFKISIDWIVKFSDIEKIKYLNRLISRSYRWGIIDTDWYKQFINKFYYDKQFNDIYNKWLESNKKDKYLKPTIDHIIPKSKGGTNEIDNLTALTWFENRAKNDMSVDEWTFIKNNIKNYIYPFD